MKPNGKIFLLGLVSGACLAGLSSWIIFEKGPSLASDKRKNSYAIGHQMAKNLLRQDVDFEPSVIALALKDLKKGTPALTPDELREAMNRVHKENMSKPKKKSKEDSTPSRLAGLPNSQKFRETPFGFSYFKGSWDSLAANQEEPSPKAPSRQMRPDEDTDRISANMNPEQKVSFHLIVRDRSGSELYNSKALNQKYAFKNADLPESLRMASAMISGGEIVLINLDSRQTEELRSSSLQLPLPLEESMLLELHRLQ